MEGSVQPKVTVDFPWVKFSVGRSVRNIKLSTSYVNYDKKYVRILLLTDK